jgi:hypothetical protein
MQNYDLPQQKIAIKSFFLGMFSREYLFTFVSQTQTTKNYKYLKLLLEF